MGPRARDWRPSVRGRCTTTEHGRASAARTVTARATIDPTRRSEVAGRALTCRFEVYKGAVIRDLLVVGKDLLRSIVDCHAASVWDDPLRPRVAERQPNNDNGVRVVPLDDRERHVPLLIALGTTF